MEALTMDTGQPEDSTRQAKHDECIYELMLYVADNKAKSQLAFDNLNKICSKYLAGKCYIEIIDLTKNPNLARADQIIAIPTLMRKNYPGKRIIGDLSNQEKVLKFLDICIDNFIDTGNEKSGMEKIPSEESKTRIVKGKKSKYDLQPYIGSNSCKQLSQNMYNWIFSLS
jgi:circadian clock protein KaiB